jgi:uncharacterized protein (TIGR02246 family)
MPRIIFLSVLMLSLTCSGRAQDMGGRDSRSVEKAKQEILKVEDDMNQAIVRGDVAMLERIFADDFTVTNPSGKIISRAQDLEEIKIGDNKLVQLNHDEIRVRVYGDTAVLSGRSRSTLQYKGNISKGPRRFTNVYVKEDGHWRIVDHHVTNVVGQ